MLNPVVTSAEAVPHPVPGLAPTQAVENIRTLLPTLPSEAGPSSQQVPTAEPELVLSAGLEPQQSWFARNKFVVIVMAVIAAGVAAFLLLH